MGWLKARKGDGNGGTGLRGSHRFAYFILEAVGYRLAQDALIHNGKTEGMAVGGCAIARKGADAFQGAGLCGDVSVSRAGDHTLAQGAVDAGKRKRGLQMQKDAFVGISVAEKGGQQAGGGVIVETQAASVGKTEVGVRP